MTQPTKFKTNFLFEFDTENVDKVLEYIRQNYLSTNYHITMNQPKIGMCVVDINITPNDLGLHCLIEQCEYIDPDDYFITN